MAERSRVFTDNWGATTQWSLIFNAAGRDDAKRLQQAWRELVERYRGPVLQSIRRQLGNRPEADEIAADFFTYLYEKGVLPKIDPEIGRFRCFIQGVIRNYVKHARRSLPGARGGSDALLDNLAGGSGIETFEQEEQAAWANAVLEHALERLREARPRDANLLIQAYGLAGHEPVPRRQLCEGAGLSENAVNVAVHRARNVLKQHILEEVQELVARPQDFLDEVKLIYDTLLSAYPGLAQD